MTDSYSGNKPLIRRLINVFPSPPRLLASWNARCSERLVGSPISSSEVLGVWFVIAMQRAKTHRERENVYIEAAKRLAAHFSRSNVEASCLWVYDSTSLETMEVAKSSGMKVMLEQTILPRHVKYSIFQSEIERHGDWQPNLVLEDAFEDVLVREKTEWKLADTVIAGSNFVKRGLEDSGLASDKIHVIPYGVDQRQFPAKAFKRKGDSPLKILFLGEIGLRKGVPYMVKALEMLPRNKIEVKMAGSVNISAEKIQSYKKLVDFLGPVPRTAVRSLLEWADVLVLPTLVEGSATVTYEAMLSGVPVLTTDNAGSLVKDRHDGDIVEAQNYESIAGVLAGYIENPDILAGYSKNLLEKRRELSLERYIEDVISLTQAFLDS